MVGTNVTSPREGGSAMGDKSPKNTAKTNKQKSQKKGASSGKK
jgi:hypothetical protein